MISQYTPAESNALAGMVISQAVMISSATLQRTLLTRSAEPTPMIAELTICDVLTGTPQKDAVRMTTAELNCVEKLCNGTYFVKLSAQCTDQAPAAETCPNRNRRGTDGDHPDRHLKRWQDSANDQTQTQ